MKYLLLAIINFTFKTALLSQTSTYEDNNFMGNSFDAYAIKIDSTVCQNFTIINNSNLESNVSFAQGLTAQDSMCFFINASIADTMCNPIGYYVKDGQEVNPINLSDGNGNFYLKPNGAILFLENGVKIVESSEIIQFNIVRTGIQSGPMLVSNGIINNQFNPQSINKHKRCGVGTFTEGGEEWLLFVISNGKVTFYDMALYMNKKFNCDNALCLESQGCSMYFPGRQFSGDEFDGIICNYLFCKM